MKRKLLLALTLAGTMVSAHAYAQMSMWTIDSAHSSATFEILHMSVSHVHGSFGNVKGMVMLDDKDITKSSVTATIDTTTVSTGNASRDTDLKSDGFFDVAKNPEMTFKSTALTKMGGKLQLVGDLTIHGITKSVTLNVDGPTPPQTMQGKTVSGFSATGMVSRKDYNIGAKYGPAMLGDDVKVTIDVEIDKK
jgi:polyisoprenoid-binding protein YceI